MVTGESLENYLKTIYVLLNKNQEVHSVDVARSMNFSKASVSHAVKNLEEKGLLEMEPGGGLILTQSGRQLAEKVYERHQFFCRQLIAVGVDAETAEREACQMEHTISSESFHKLKTALLKQQDAQEEITNNS